MTDSLTREVRDPTEYKDVVDAAATLGLEPAQHDFYGGWESDDGYPVFPKEHDVEKVGRKYFHVDIDGDTVPIKPVDGPSGRGRISVELNGSQA